VSLDRKVSVKFWKLWVSEVLMRMYPESGYGYDTAWRRSAVSKSSCCDTVILLHIFVFFITSAITF